MGRARILAMFGLALACASDPPPPDTLVESRLALTLRNTCPGRATRDECACRGQSAAGPASLAANSCENWIDFWIEDSRDADLTYDGVCARRLLEANQVVTDSDEHTCSLTPPTEPTISCEDECQIYFGDGDVGDACTRFGRRMSTCTADLLCGADERCHEPCDRPLQIEIGKPCGYKHQGLLEEQCADGLVCNPETSTCDAPLAAGDTCDYSTPPCPADHECNDSQCVPRGAIGAVCERHYDCLSLVCIANVCAEPDPWSCDHPWF